MGKLIIDGNSVYEIDEDCMEAKCRKHEKARDEQRQQKNVRQQNQSERGRRRRIF